VDVRILPASSASGIYVNGISEGGAFGNNGGSLATTASLFIGNYSQNNTQNFSGSIYAIKTYNIQSLTQPSVNYAAISTRLGKSYSTINNPVFELLVVAGGGGGGRGIGGGGGAGVLQYFSNFQPTPGISTAVVGDGGEYNLPGNNSSFSTFVSIGGGDGGSSDGVYQGPAGNGGSGGGGGYNQTPSGSGILGQGNNGGVASGFSAAGGGGAGSTGLDGVNGGQGGSGSYIASFAAIGGSPAGWFAGGGGRYGTSGGIGGTNISFTGSSNTGAGGSGGSSGGGVGYKGGSGIVAIRYSGGPIAVGGEITQSAGYTYHVFRTVGTSSFTIF